MKWRCKLFGHDWKKAADKKSRDCLRCNEHEDFVMMPNWFINMATAAWNGDPKANRDWDELNRQLGAKD